MVYCFSCGAQLGGSVELGRSRRCQACLGREPERQGERAARAELPKPVLTLVRTFPGAPEPPPFAAA